MLWKALPTGGKAHARVKTEAGQVTCLAMKEQNTWVWVIDEQSMQPAGLGICQVDQTIGEGSMEWIQVLPEYHDRRLGTAMVRLLLARLETSAKFETVSGEARKLALPEALFRRRGCMGNDLWWVLSS